MRECIAQVQGSAKLASPFRTLLFILGHAAKTLVQKLSAGQLGWGLAGKKAWRVSTNES